MNSIQDKIGWKKMRKRKIKIIVPLHPVPIRRVTKNSQKNSKIIQKIKNYHCGFISSKNRLEKNEKERK